MRRPIAIVLLAGLGLGCGFIHSDAEKAFWKWEKAVTNGVCPEIQAGAVGPALEWGNDYCTPKGGMTVYGKEVPGRSAADLAANASGNLSNATLRLKRVVESEEKQSDGTVKLVMLEKVMVPESRRKQYGPPRRYRVTMQEVGGDWKVKEYATEDVPD